MATNKTRRKTNTAMVFNPSRGLSIGGRSTVRRARRANPTARRPATKLAVNPRRKRRRRNPSGFSVLSNPSGGALVGALLAGVAFSFADFGLSRVLPASASPAIQIGTKLAAGFVIQQFGNKVPLLGKYKDGVAFLFFGLAASQFASYYLLPTVRNTLNQFTGQALQLISPPPAQAAPPTLGGIYGSQRAYA